MTPPSICLVTDLTPYFLPHRIAKQQNLHIEPKYYKSAYGNFEKLNKLNYTSWRAKVTGALRLFRAYKTVTGEEQAPPEGNSAAARATITDYNARYGRPKQ